MPKKLERILKRSAKAKGIEPGSDRFKRYVYGTMSKIEAKKRAAK